MFKRPFSRGSSILAALVFVGILGAVAYGVQLLNPSSNQNLAVNIQAMTAQVGEAYRTAPASPTKKGVSAACDTAKKSAAASGNSRTSFETKEEAIDDCVGAVLDTSKKNLNPKDANSYKCVGKIARVAMKSGSVSEKSDANPAKPAGTCAVIACQDEGLGQQRCFSVKDMYGIDKNKLSQYMSGGVENVRPFTVDNENMSKLFDPKTGLPLEKSSLRELNDAFTEQGQEAQEIITKNSTDIDKLDYQINNCAFSGGECGDQNIEDLKKQKDALEAKNRELKQQVSDLGETQKNDLVPAVDGPFTQKDTGYECRGAAVCYATNQKGIEALNAKGYTCQAAGDYSVCTPKGQNPPWSGPGAQAPPCTVGKCPSNAGPGEGDDKKGSPSGLEGLLKSMLGGMMKGLTGAGAATGAACSSDPNAYQQQQQQYNQQLQQYQYQLQQYNYQQQMSQYNGLPAPVAPVAPVPCQHNSSQNTCAAAPAQPAASGCSNGTWRPVTTQQSNGASCTTSWQCVPGGSGAAPTAQISCNPQVADVGMTIAIAYSCTNATASTGSGFSTGGATSGSATTTLANPPAGANTANFGITCTNQSLIGQAQCSVQIGRPSIVLVANPRIVASGASSTIGWVTSGMSSCIVSSADMPAFTTANATNTSVNGMAITPAITADAGILLRCLTVGGSTRDATTTVLVATSTSP